MGHRIWLVGRKKRRIVCWKSHWSFPSFEIFWNRLVLTLIHLNNHWSTCTWICSMLASVFTLSSLSNPGNQGFMDHRNADHRSETSNWIGSSPVRYLIFSICSVLVHGSLMKPIKSDLERFLWGCWPLILFPFWSIPKMLISKPLKLTDEMGFQKVSAVWLAEKSIVSTYQHRFENASQQVQSGLDFWSNIYFTRFVD